MSGNGILLDFNPITIEDWIYFLIIPDSEESDGFLLENCQSLIGGFHVPICFMGLKDLTIHEWLKFVVNTLPETNIAPGNGWLEY